MERPCDAETANEHFLCEVAQQFFAKRAAHLHSDKLSKNGIRMTPMNMMLAGARGPAWKRMFCDFASRAHAAECLQDSLMYTLAACTMHFVDNNAWEVLLDCPCGAPGGVGTDRLCAIADVELGHGGRDPVDIKLPRVEQLARLTNIACEPSEHSPDIKNVGVDAKFSAQ